jgi:hypothetical protein
VEVAEEAPSPDWAELSDQLLKNLPYADMMR